MLWLGVLKLVSFTLTSLACSPLLSRRYDDYAFERIADSAFGRSARAGRLEQVTFLRMGDLMFDNWDAFSRFLKRMRMRPATIGSPPASGS